MGSKLVFIIVAFSFATLLLPEVAVSFVISPSQIDVPILTSGSIFVIDIVSDTKLSLLQTNCSSVSITLTDNALTLSTSQFAVSNTEWCVISVYEEEKPSVSFDFVITVNINSALRANMTITYDETHLFIENIGTGRGKLWVTSGTAVELCNIDPGALCTYEPSGLAVVCSDLECNTRLFSHEFKTKDISASDDNYFDIRNKSKIGIWIVMGAVLLTTVLTGLYYFARRNDALLKNTS